MADTTNPLYGHLIGKHVLIRSSESGVHCGVLLAVSLHSKMVVRLKDSRRLWEWATTGNGISLSEVAIAGIDQKGSKITEVIPDIVVADACEIIECHGTAVPSIMGADTFKPT